MIKLSVVNYVGLIMLGVKRAKPEESFFLSYFNSICNDFLDFLTACHFWPIAKYKLIDATAALWVRIQFWYAWTLLFLLNHGFLRPWFWPRSYLGFLSYFVLLFTVQRLRTRVLGLWNVDWFSYSFFLSFVKPYGGYGFIAKFFPVALENGFARISHDH